MSKPASIPFFGDAYLADTTHLTTEEHGAYFLLLLAAWRQDDCALPNEDRKLARIAGLSTKKWLSIKSTIMDFWQVEDGRIYQSRLRKEHDFVCRKSEANRKSAEARWNKQGAENKQDWGMRSHSEGNAPPPPPPPPVEEPKGSPTAPKAPKPKSQSVAKISMPADWTPAPLPDAYAEMVVLWPPGRFEREAVEFREYWIDNGQKRPGWDASWRKRITAIHDRIMRDTRNGYGNQPSRGNEPTEPVNAFVRAAAERQAKRAAAER